MCTEVHSHEWQSFFMAKQRDVALWNVVTINIPTTQ